MKHLGMPLQIAGILALIALQGGCGKSAGNTPVGRAATPVSEAPAVPIDPCRIVLVPHPGGTRLDDSIIKAQKSVDAGPNREAALERLGWLFVEKARATFDDGFYKLAEQCARCVESDGSTNASVLLLRGHVLHNLHKFKEAEPIARRLAAQRGSPMDFGLLGDVLMDMGRLDDAISAYQQMMDLRPDSRAYARAAHVRWLKGDLNGAIEAMEEAAGSVSARDAETAAWVFTRLAAFKFQAAGEFSLPGGEPDFTEAARGCAVALELNANHPPALLLRGRILLAQRNLPAAIEALELAEKLNSLPEYQWTLAEALRAAGRGTDAAKVEIRLRQHGAATDRRTLSLFLATRGEEGALAVRLAEEEFQQRQDVFTHDALAWAMAAAGRFDEAQRHISSALAEGTRDGRLFLHAGVIAAMTGRFEQSGDWLRKAAALTPLLLPAELSRLEAAIQRIPAPTLSSARPASVESR